MFEAKRRYSNNSEVNDDDRQDQEKDSTSLCGEHQVMNSKDVIKAIKQILTDDTIADILTRAIDSKLSTINQQIEKIDVTERNHEDRLQRLEQRL